MKALLLAPMGSVHRRFNRANIDALRSLGYEVHLVANFENGEGTEKQNKEYVDQCMQEGIIVHSIPYARHSLKKTIAETGETRKLLQSEHFNIVHAHTETGGLILRLAGRTYSDTKYIYTPHGMSFYKGSSLKSQLMYRPVERWICSGMDCNIAINQEEYGVLNQWNDKSANFVHGIGLNLSNFSANNVNTANSIRREFGIPETAKVIVSVGELDDNKNHRVIIQSLSKVRQDNVYYLICGVGPNVEKLKRLANSLGVGNRFILAGYRQNISQILHACDIFAFPSFHEGLPVSLLEAMASGLPVVCSNIRGNNDVIEHGLNGFLTSPEDEDKFAFYIQLLLTDKDKSAEMGIINKKRVMTYSKEFVAEELKKIYQHKVSSK